MCSTELGGKPFIEKDGDFYCENDFYDKFNPKCGHCDEVIKGMSHFVLLFDRHTIRLAFLSGQYISALDQAWHPDHFVCTVCNQPFAGNQFRKHGNKPYCEDHYIEITAEKCTKCGLSIVGSFLLFVRPYF